MGKAASKEKGKRGQLDSGLKTDSQKTEVEVPFDQYAFPFENAVFEGGPLTSLAYVGAVRFLEDVGIWSKIQRLAGSGTGAIVASLLCIGFNSHQLQNFFETDLRTIAHDACCGKLCLGCNMSSRFGWNPNKKILSWFGSKMKEATGKADTTFIEVFQRFGKELCVPVTNVSEGCLGYCHPKTTPHLPIQEAVRISLSMPGLSSPWKSKIFGEEEYFVEGTLLSAYPIHCFDGWWLSLKSEDSFFKRLTALNDLPTLLERTDRFGSVNAKTLGFLVYDEASLESFAPLLDESNRIRVVQPDTKLARKWTEKQAGSKAIKDKYNKYRTTAEKFYKSLTAAIPDEKQAIEKSDLQNIIQKDTTLGVDDLTLLFGRNHAVDEILTTVKTFKKDAITQQDFAAYFGHRCFAIQAQYRNSLKKEIKTLVDYFEALQVSAVQNGRSAIKSEDLDRSIGINVRFLTGLRNERLDSTDRAFLMEQGKLAAKAYLQRFISKSVPPIKDAPNRQSFCRDDLPCFIDDEVSEIIDERDYMENLIGRVL